MIRSGSSRFSFNCAIDTSPNTFESSNGRSYLLVLMTLCEDVMSYFPVSTPASFLDYHHGGGGSFKGRGGHSVYNSNDSWTNIEHLKLSY